MCIHICTYYVHINVYIHMCYTYTHMHIYMSTYLPIHARGAARCAQGRLTLSGVAPPFRPGQNLVWSKPGLSRIPSNTHSDSR